MLKVALPQIAPCWINRDAGIARVVETIETASREGAGLIAFGEAFVPGYPYWVSETDGARFESRKQKELFAHYSDQAVTIERGDLDPVCDAARSAGMACYLGVIERPRDRSGHSLYASFVYIDPQGKIGSVQRKMCPTYEERLVWSNGDGAGLRTHRLGEFTLGGLNCWENWMPLSRAALYAQGEDVHVACWPGSIRNTEDITRFIAREGRGYCISVSAVMRREDVRNDTPYVDELRSVISERHNDGGSCVAAPDGSWVLPPVVDEVGIRTCELDPAFVRRERQNFDATGHYSRPDVTRLVVDRRRQSVIDFE